MTREKGATIKDHPWQVCPGPECPFHIWPAEKQTPGGESKDSTCLACGYRIAAAGEWCMATRDGDHRPALPPASTSTEEVARVLADLRTGVDDTQYGKGLLFAIEEVERVLPPDSTSEENQ